MLRGIYCSNTGLNTQQNRVDVLANNLANINTPGFKEGKITVSTFKEILVPIDEGNSYFRTSNGTNNIMVIPELSSHTLQQTGGEYDFAIDGDAFFALDTPEGVMYSTKGEFCCDEQGFLTDYKGNKVIGESGFISVSDGQLKGNFRLVRIGDQGTRIPKGNSLFAADQTAISTADDVRVLRGFLEVSAVDIVYNMVELLAASRSYSLNCRVLMAQDTLLKKSSEEVGRLK